MYLSLPFSQASRSGLETHVDLGWVARWSTKAYSAGPVTYSLTHLEPGPLPERELLRVMLAVDRVDEMVAFCEP